MDPLGGTTMGTTNVAKKAGIMIMPARPASWCLLCLRIKRQ